jgi:hypothetical protein
VTSNFLCPAIEAVDFLPVLTDADTVSAGVLSHLSRKQPVSAVLRVVQSTMAALGENVFAPPNGDCWRFFEFAGERYVGNLYLDANGDVLFDAFTTSCGGADADFAFIHRHPVAESLFLPPAGHA